jgi:hypothetical protein
MNVKIPKIMNETILNANDGGVVSNLLLRIFFMRKKEINVIANIKRR